MPTLLQLVARSICTSNRCLPSELGKHKVLCKSPLEPGGQSTDKSAGLANSASTSRPCLEDTTMVPNSTSRAHRSPSVDNSGTRGSGQRGSLAPTSSASRMAHLRKKFRDQNLSEEATALMLKSWRTKTNKSYDSLFSKWHNWCIERSYDPFSGPIAMLLTLWHTYSKRDISTVPLTHTAQQSHRCMRK